MKVERKRKILEWFIALGTALVLVFLIRSFLFTIIRVDGQSMLNTLSDGDRLIVTIPDLKLSGPNRGDIVICRYPNSRAYYVKRVVGLAGDTVALRAGRLFLNGYLVKEPYIRRSTGHYGPVLVPDNTVFVLGDNRAASSDSRLASVGPIPLANLVGRVRVAFH